MLPLMTSDVSLRHLPPALLAVGAYQPLQLPSYCPAAAENEWPRRVTSGIGGKACGLATRGVAWHDA